MPEELVLLYHFDRFVDAGSAGSRRRPPACWCDGPWWRGSASTGCSITAAAPTMTFAADHWADYGSRNWPYGCCGTRTRSRSLFTGPEPDREWGRSAAAAGPGATLAGTTAGERPRYSDGRPHTRPLVSRRTRRPELVRSYRTVLTRSRCRAPQRCWSTGWQAGHDVIGFTAHVLTPRSVAVSGGGAASVDAVTEATGLQVPLADPVRRLTPRIWRSIVRSRNAEAADVVRALEQQYDAFTAAAPGSNLLADADSLPSGDELAEHFQRFLAEQQQDRFEQGES